MFTASLMRRIVVVLGLAAVVTASVVAHQDPRAILLNPGTVNVSVAGSSWWIANDSLTVTWDASAGIRVSSVYDRLGGRTGTKPGEAFTVGLPDGRVIKGSECTLRGTPAVDDVAPAAPTLPPGRQLEATFECADGALQLTWQADLLPGANAARQRVAITRGVGTVTAADVGYQSDPAKVWPTEPLNGLRILAGPYLQHPGPSSMTVSWSP